MVSGVSIKVETYLFHLLLLSVITVYFFVGLPIFMLNEFTCHIPSAIVSGQQFSTILD
jgi:hypothetical protein